MLSEPVYTSGGRFPGDYDGYILLELLLWAYLNVEDLSQLKALFEILKARSESTPASIVTKDVCAILFGYAIGSLNRLRMISELLQPESQPSKSLVDLFWESLSSDQSQDRFQTLRQQVPRKILNALEVQKALFEFLNKICRLLLHDINELGDEASHHTLDQDQFKAQPSSPLVPVISGTGEQIRLPAFVMEANHNSPVVVQFEKLIELAGWHAEAARDHV
jgi:hypothetical protein